MICLENFHSVDIRVGQVLEAKDNTKAKKPAYVLTIDFGPEIGIRVSSTQIVPNYSKDELIGKQVLAVVNFPPRRVADVTSEVLVLAAVWEQSNPVLIAPIGAVPNGARIL